MEQSYSIPSKNIDFPNHPELALLDKEFLRPSIDGNFTVPEPDENGFVISITLHENDIINSVKLPVHDGVKEFQIHYLTVEDTNTWKSLHTVINKVRT